MSWWRRLVDGPELEPVDHLDVEPEPVDLADDLPHVITTLAATAATTTGPTQTALVQAVTDILTAHEQWLTAHPAATAAERAATAQRTVFRAVQAGIDVVRPAAERAAVLAARREAAEYVAAQRSVTEAAEGLRRHATDVTLPLRVERYPVAEQLARTTGQQPAVAPAAELSP